MAAESLQAQLDSLESKLLIAQERELQLRTRLQLRNSTQVIKGTAAPPLEVAPVSISQAELIDFSGIICFCTHQISTEDAMSMFAGLDMVNSDSAPTQQQEGDVDMLKEVCPQSLSIRTSLFTGWLECATADG